MRKIMLLIAAVAIVSLSSCVDGTILPADHANESRIIDTDTLNFINDSTFIYEGDTVTFFRAN